MGLFLFDNNWFRAYNLQSWFQDQLTLGVKGFDRITVASSAGCSC